MKSKLFGIVFGLMLGASSLVWGRQVATGVALLLNNTYVSSSNPLPVSAGVAQSSGGASTFTNSGSAITTAVTVDSSAGSCYALALTNTSAGSTYYAELFNTTSPTLGTTAPAWVIVVPPGPAGTVEHFPIPLAFGTAISIAFVTSPNGSSVAPGSTCYASVAYK